MHASIYLWRGDVLGFALLHDTCAYYCASIGNIRMLHTSRVRPMHESVVLLVLRFASHQSFRKCLCFRRDWYECLKVIWWSVNPETLGGWSNRSTKTEKHVVVLDYGSFSACQLWCVCLWLVGLHEYYWSAAHRKRGERIAIILFFCCHVVVMCIWLHVCLHHFLTITMAGHYIPCDELVVGTMLEDQQMLCVCWLVVCLQGYPWCVSLFFSM